RGHDRDIAARGLDLVAGSLEAEGIAGREGDRISGPGLQTERVAREIVDRDVTGRSDLYIRAARNRLECANRNGGVGSARRELGRRRRGLAIQGPGPGRGIDNVDVVGVEQQRARAAVGGAGVDVARERKRILARHLDEAAVATIAA